MVDVDTFLTMLYVMVDAFCKASWPAAPPPGPQAARNRSEVLTVERERPQDRSGFQARLAAQVRLQNFCMWVNGQLGRPWLAFTDWIAW
jgi:hypothetical protein